MKKLFTLLTVLAVSITMGMAQQDKSATPGDAKGKGAIGEAKGKGPGGKGALGTQGKGQRLGGTKGKGPGPAGKEGRGHGRSGKFGKGPAGKQERAPK